MKFRWFTGACIVLILTGIAHLGAMLGPQPEPRTPDEAKMFELVRSQTLDLLGTKRTLEQVEQGFHYFFVLASITMGAGGLAVSSARPRSAGAIKRLAAVYMVGWAAVLADSLIHWFIIPTALAGAAMLLFAISLARDGRDAGAGTVPT